MEFLAPLALLACPVGMGLMMWFMMRSGKKAEGGRRSVAELRSEQRRLDAEIERAERQESRGLDEGIAGGR